MSNAMLSGVSGMSAHQKMIDVAGNNLANMSTTAFKASRVSFADLLSETIAQASQPTESIGGTNPIQIGSGVRLASVDRNMTQGTLTTTGEPLDMAIEGEGYFVLRSASGEMYTRVGTFGVDSDYFLVDPATGYRVQRIGSEGLADGFQDVGNDSIKVPYDTALPASPTTMISYNGNLSSDAADPTTTILGAGEAWTDATTGSRAREATLLANLTQANGNIDGSTITLTGTDRDGAAVSATLNVAAATTTIQDLLDTLNGAYGDATAMLYNGELRLRDNEAGYSLTDMSLAFTAGGGGGTLELPSYFKLLEAGGNASRNTNVEIFDSQGVSHTLTGSFVRTDTNNMWDFVVTAITGDVELVDRRVQGITFQSDGSYGGLDETVGGSATLGMRFANDPDSTNQIEVSLGTVNEFDGISQFGGAFTVAPNGQDGYASGTLSSISVTREGVLQGTFTNGVRKDIAAIKMAVFQNPAGLEATGSNYFIASANSGTPISTKGAAGGAGSVHGGMLESSNVDVAKEFVNLIQAQNGYQANARTIRVSNDMLQQLTTLLR